MQEDLIQAINTMQRAMNGPAAAYRPYLETLIGAAKDNDRLITETHNWAAAVKKLEAAQPAPLADGELSELERLLSVANAGPFFLNKGLEKIWIETAPENGIVIAECALGHKRGYSNAQLIATALNTLPSLLARLAAAETELARYRPAPLPTGWVLRGEMDPEEELRCEIELHHHGEGQPPLYAVYWEGREGDFATWTDEQGNWYHDNEVARYRYVPAETVKGGQPDAA